jgi:plastocyanin
VHQRGALWLVASSLAVASVVGSSVVGSPAVGSPAGVASVGTASPEAAVPQASGAVERRAIALGAIRGRVDAPIPAFVAPRPAVEALGQPALPDAPDRRRSVLYLESAPQAAFEEADLPRLVLDQRNQTFVPWVLAVPVGATVEFPNNDSTFHNVFSLSKARRFDLGRYPRGASRSVRFDRPGVVRVFCEIHAHMNAYVLVFSHRFFATTDESGRYRMSGVPPGDYRLVLWYDGREREVRPVQVAAGVTAEADFVVR